MTKYNALLKKANKAGSMMIEALAMLNLISLVDAFCATVWVRLPVIVTLPSVMVVWVAEEELATCVTSEEELFSLLAAVSLLAGVVPVLLEESVGVTPADEFGVSIVAEEDGGRAMEAVARVTMTRSFTSMLFMMMVEPSAAIMLPVV